MARFKLSYFGHLMQRPSSLEKALMVGKGEEKRRGQSTVKWIVSFTVVMGAWLEDVDQPKANLS